MTTVPVVYDQLELATDQLPKLSNTETQNNAQTREALEKVKIKSRLWGQAECEREVKLSKDFESRLLLNDVTFHDFLFRSVAKKTRTLGTLDYPIRRRSTIDTHMSDGRLLFGVPSATQLPSCPGQNRKNYEEKSHADKHHRR